MWNKQATLALLRQRGINRVVLEFSGGNDEGGADSIRFFKPVQPTPDIRGALKLAPATEVEVTLNEKDEADRQLIEACEESVYSQFHGFAGDFEVYGTVTFDVAAGTVVMEVNESDKVWRQETREL